MTTALRDGDFVVLDAIDQSVFVVDAARPVAGQVALQRFGFSGTLEEVALDFLDEQVDPANLRLVGLLPIEVVTPCNLMEFNLHRATAPVRRCFFHALYRR